ncbi:MAG: sugar fermentation stimulation protein SfsA, partial [Desulfovibrio sp.]|nr:sugar fermentation stimulation protein SfsA [Desulfovibrio sp.]
MSFAGILLPFPPGCVQGIMLRRLKRFSVDVLLEGGLCRVHTNNSGAMLGLVREGLPVWLSPASGPGRKSAYTLEMIRLPGSGLWVGVNTLVPNRLLRAAFQAGLLPWAAGYTA